MTDHLLFKPLPYADPDRLVTVGADIRSKGQSNWAVAPPEYDAWRQGIGTLTDLGGYQPFGRYTLSLSEAPVEVSVVRITGNFLSVLGVAPAIGRPFNDADFAPGAPLAMLLTDSAWRRFFGSDPAIAGRLVTMNGALAEVAGVLPRSFAFPSGPSADQPNVVVPLVRAKESDAASGISMIGRLAPGRAIETARAEIDAVAAFRAGGPGSGMPASTGRPSSRSVTRFRNDRGRRSSCSLAPWLRFSSDARTSRICCSPAARIAGASWPFARLSVRLEVRSCACC